MQISSSIELELLPPKVLHWGNRKFCIFFGCCGFDLDPIYCSITYGQTYRQTLPNLLPRHFAVV